MDGLALSPSKKMSDPLTEQEIFLNNLNLIAVRRVKVKYSRTIKERLRATTKEESLSLPSVARGKQACSPVRRKPDVSPGRAGSPSPRQRLDMSVTPGPSGINIQGGINVLQSIKRRRKIKNVTPPSTKSLLSYLHRKSSEELENGSSSTEEGEEEETYENASLEDPNWEPFRLREVSIQMSRVGSFVLREFGVHNTPNSSKSSLIPTSPAAEEQPQPPMNGWARIDADHYDRNEQLKNLISDLEAEILEREMEYAKKKLSLGEKTETASIEPPTQPPPPQSTQTLQSDIEIRERILRDLNLRPELDISEESRIDPEELREIAEDTTISLQLPTVLNQANKTSETSQSEVNILKASSNDMPVGLLTTVQTNLQPVSVTPHQDNPPSVATPSVANSSFDSVLSTITESSIKSEIKEEPQSYETAVTESIVEEYEELPGAGDPADVKQEYLQTFSIIPTQHSDDMEEIEVKYSETKDILNQNLASDIPISDGQPAQVNSTQQPAIQSSTRSSTRQQELLNSPGTSRPNHPGRSLERIVGEDEGAGSEPEKTVEQKSKNSLVDILSQSADSDEHEIVRTKTSKIKMKRKNSFIQKQMEMLNKIQNQNKHTSETPAVVQKDVKLFRKKRVLTKSNIEDKVPTNDLEPFSSPTPFLRKISEPAPHVDEPATNPQTEDNSNTAGETRLEKDVDDNSDDQDDFYGFGDKDEIFAENTIRNNEIDDLERDNYGELKCSKIKYRRKSTEVTKLLNSTGGLKIYRHVDLKIRQTSFEAEHLKLKDHKENEHEIEMEEKKERFQDIDKDERELWEILKEKREPERRRRGNPFYLIPFHSGIEELDFKVNRERQQTLIIKRRMFNASDGRARSNATEGKAMAPSMTKYTYWTPKLDDEESEDLNAYKNIFLAPDQISKATRKSKPFTRLTRPSLADILQARRILGIDQESRFNYDAQDVKEEKPAPPTVQKTSLSFRKGECHLRRRSDSGGSTNPAGVVPRIKRVLKKKLKGLRRGFVRKSKELDKFAHNLNRGNHDYIDIDNIEALVDNEPVEDSSSCSESSQHDFFSCRLCHTRFNNNQSLELHELSCKPFSCKFCLTRFRSLKLCHRHEVSHQKKSRRRLGDADSGSSEASTSSGSLSCLVAAATGFNQDPTSHTNPAVNFKGSQNEIEITCVECGEVFDRESTFRKHRYAYHAVQRTQDGTTPPVGSFLQVATGLHQLSRLKQEGIATSITAPLGGRPSLAGQSGATSPSKYKCNIPNCNKSFLKRDSLERHVFKHAQGTITPWKCRQCSASYRSEKKLLKHIGDVHGMQKQLRAQYRMVNVSKRMEEGDYDLENMVVFDMESINPSLYHAQDNEMQSFQLSGGVNSSDNVQISGSDNMDNVQQALQAANEGLMIEVELMDPAENMSEIMLGDMSNLVVNSPHLVQNLQHLVNQPLSSSEHLVNQSLAPEMNSESELAGSSANPPVMTPPGVNPARSVNSLESPGGVDPMQSTDDDNNTVHDVLSFIKSTATQLSTTAASTKGDTGDKAVASSSGVKQIKRRLSKSAKDGRGTKLAKSLGKRATEVKLSTPPSREISDPENLGKFGYVLTSPPNIDELLDSPDQRQSKERSVIDEGNESMDEDIEKIQSFLGQGISTQDSQTQVKFDKVDVEKEEDISDIINFITTSQAKPKDTGAAAADTSEKTEEDILYLNSLPSTSNKILELVSSDKPEPEKSKTAVQPEDQKHQKFKIPKSPLKRVHGPATAGPIVTKKAKISFEEQLISADTSLDAVKSKKTAAASSNNLAAVKKKVCSSADMKTRKTAKLIPLPLGDMKAKKKTSSKSSKNLTSKEKSNLGTKSKDNLIDKQRKSKEGSVEKTGIAETKPIKEIPKIISSDKSNNDKKVEDSKLKDDSSKSSKIDLKSKETPKIQSMPKLLDKNDKNLDQKQKFSKRISDNKALKPQISHQQSPDLKVIKKIGHTPSKDKLRSPDAKPKKKLDLSTYKKVRKAVPKTPEGMDNITEKVSTAASEKKEVRACEIDLDEIIRQPSKLGVGRLKQQQQQQLSDKTTANATNKKPEFPSKEELKQVLSVVNPAKTATEDTPNTNKDTENATEERPRDPRLHSSKQLQKQTKDILDIVKPILEKAKKTKTAAASKPEEELERKSEEKVEVDQSSSAQPEKARKGRMLLPAPVPASNLSSEDESPVASSKGQSGGGHLNNCVEDSPTIVMSSKQGYFTEKSKAVGQESNDSVIQSLPTVSRGVSAPGVLGLELASSAACKGAELAAATVLSNMLPANILTYSSPLKSVQTSLASGISDGLIPPAGIVPLQSSAFRQKLHKMGQTVTKSGTGDALIQIQCTSDQSAAATTTSAADSHYPSTVSATSYTSTTSASSQSITSVMSASASYNTVSSETKVPTVNPDSQPVISSRPGGFARAPGAPGGQLDAARFSGVPGSLNRKLSLPVPVSGINQLTRPRLLTGMAVRPNLVPQQLPVPTSQPPTQAGAQTSTAFFQAKSDTSGVSRPKLSLPKPVPAAIASPAKPAPGSKQT